MRTRYLTNVTLLLVGGFALVTSFAFGVGIYTWLLLGSGAVAAATAIVGMGLRGRGATQRSLDGVMGLAGAWMIIVSRVFVGTVMMWLGFAAGAALIAVALIGLTLHEIHTERVVHSLEVPAAPDAHPAEGTARFAGVA